MKVESGFLNDANVSLSFTKFSTFGIHFPTTKSNEEEAIYAINPEPFIPNIRLGRKHRANCTMGEAKFAAEATKNNDIYRFLRKTKVPKGNMNFTHRTEIFNWRETVK